MIQLSVNVNKIATLRNSRGGNIPNLVELSHKILAWGASGITIHPREDERHIRRSDIQPLCKMLQEFNAEPENAYKELNIEGDPSPRFLEICQEFRPNQATLVPVTPGEITSDHGFQFPKDLEILETFVEKLKEFGIRVSVFVEAGVENLHLVKALGVDRVELYTGPFAHAFDEDPRKAKEIYSKYEATAREALSLGLGVNAGHDLDSRNLEIFRNLSGLLEVSIGHRLISDALEWGLERTIQIYQSVLNPL